MQKSRDSSSGELVQNSSMSEVMSSRRKHTYIIRTDSNISNSNVFSDNMKIIDNES